MTNLLTVKEISELYDLSKDCIKRNIKKHGLKPKGIKNKSIQYDANEIEKMTKGLHGRKKRVQQEKELWKVSIWNETFWAVQHCSMSRIEAQVMAEEYERNGKTAKISKNIEKKNNRNRPCCH